LKLSTLFAVNAVFALIGGLGLLFMPQQIMANYGTNLNEGGKLVTQLFSTVLFGIAIISWLFRNVKDKSAQVAVLWGFVVAHGASFIIAFASVLSGALNQMGWIDIILHGTFAAGFGYYLQKAKT